MGQPHSVIVILVGHSVGTPAAVFLALAGRRRPAPARLRQLALKRHASISELALEFGGLALQVSEALALPAAVAEL
jgi:hypothetical protein